MQHIIVSNSHLQKRIKELEEENRVLKSERDKQVKFFFLNSV